MFKIKSIDAGLLIDTKGEHAVRLTLSIWPVPVVKEKVIPGSVFADKNAADRAIEVVKDLISPVIKDVTIYWNLDLKPLYGKIQALDNDYFKDDPSGKVLFKSVTSLIKDVFNMDFLLYSSMISGS